MVDWGTNGGQDAWLAGKACAPAQGEKHMSDLGSHIVSSSQADGITNNPSNTHGQAWKLTYKDSVARPMERLPWRCVGVCERGRMATMERRLCNWDKHSARIRWAATMCKRSRTERLRIMGCTQASLHNSSQVLYRGSDKHLEGPCREVRAMCMSSRTNNAGALCLPTSKSVPR